MQGGGLGLEMRVSIDVLFHNQWLPIIYTPGEMASRDMGTYIYSLNSND